MPLWLGFFLIATAIDVVWAIYLEILYPTDFSQAPYFIPSSFFNILAFPLVILPVTAILFLIDYFRKFFSKKEK